ncbi:unnamed protein product [Tenebrio molitor]|nr:unnamed protein product [Tenebrio molitor]
MFNGIQIRAASWPIHNNNSNLIKVLSHYLSCVRPGIIIHQYEVRKVQHEVPKWLLRICLLLTFPDLHLPAPYGLLKISHHKP